MHNKITVKEVLTWADYGTMLPTIIAKDEKLYTAFVIKEEDRIIEQIKSKSNTNITFAFGCLPIKINLNKKVDVLTFLVLLNNNYDMLYESYINFNSSDNGNSKDMIYLLSKQDIIPILIFDKTIKCKVSLNYRNEKKDIFRQVYNYLKNCKPWSMNDFNLAKEYIYKKYPTPEDLFKHITNISNN